MNEHRSSSEQGISSGPEVAPLGQGISPHQQIFIGSNIFSAGNIVSETRQSQTQADTEDDAARYHRERSSTTELTPLVKHMHSMYNHKNLGVNQHRLVSTIICFGALNLTDCKEDSFGCENTAETTTQQIGSGEMATFEHVTMINGAKFESCFALSNNITDLKLIQFVKNFPSLPRQSKPIVHSTFYSSASTPKLPNQQACSPLSYRDALLYALLGKRDPQTLSADEKERSYVAIAATCRTIIEPEQEAALHEKAQTFIANQLNPPLPRLQRATATAKVSSEDGTVETQELFPYETQDDALHIETTSVLSHLVPEYIQECQASNKVEQFILEQFQTTLTNPSTPVSSISAICYDLQRYVTHLPMDQPPLPSYRDVTHRPVTKDTWLRQLAQLAATDTANLGKINEVIASLLDYYRHKDELDQSYVAKLEADKPNFYLQLLKNALAYDLQMEKPSDYQQWDEIFVDVLNLLGDQERLITDLRTYRAEILKPNQNNIRSIIAALENTEESCRASTALNNTRLKTRLLECITQAKNIVSLAYRPALLDDSEEAQNNAPNKQLRLYALPAYTYLQAIDAALCRLSVEEQLAEALVEQFPELKTQWIVQIELSLTTINTTQALSGQLEEFSNTTDNKQQADILGCLRTAVAKLGKRAPEMTVIAAIDCMLQTLDDILNAQGTRKTVQTLKAHIHFLQQKNTLIENTKTSSKPEPQPGLMRLRRFALKCQQNESHLLEMTDERELLALISDFNQVLDSEANNTYDALLLPLNNAWFKAKYPVERISFAQTSIHFIQNRGSWRPPPTKPLALTANAQVQLIEQFYVFSLQHKNFHDAFHTLGNMLLRRIEGNDSSYLFTCILMAIYYYAPIPGRNNANAGDSPGMQQLLCSDQTIQKYPLTLSSELQAEFKPLLEAANKLVTQNKIQKHDKKQEFLHSINPLIETLKSKDLENAKTAAAPMRLTLTRCIEILMRLYVFGTDDAEISPELLDGDNATTSVTTACNAIQKSERAILKTLFDFLATPAPENTVTTQTHSTNSVMATEASACVTPPRLTRAGTAISSLATSHDTPPKEEQTTVIENISAAISLLASANLHPSTRPIKLRLLRERLANKHIDITSRYIEFPGTAHTQASSKSDTTHEDLAAPSQDAAAIQNRPPIEIIIAHISAILDIYDSSQAQHDKNTAIIEQLKLYSYELLNYCKTARVGLQTTQTLATSILQLAIALFSDEEMRSMFPKYNYDNASTTIKKYLKQLFSSDEAGSQAQPNSSASQPSTPSDKSNSFQFVRIDASPTTHLSEEFFASPKASPKTVHVSADGCDTRLAYEQSPHRRKILKSHTNLMRQDSRNPDHYFAWFDTVLAMWSTAIEANQATVTLASIEHGHRGTGVYDLVWLCRLYKQLNKGAAGDRIKKAARKQLKDIIKSSSTITMNSTTADFLIEINGRIESLNKERATNLFKIFTYTDDYGIQAIREGRVERQIVLNRHTCIAIYSQNTAEGSESLKTNAKRLRALEDSTDGAPMLAIVSYSSEDPNSPLVVVAPQSKHIKPIRADQKQIHIVCQLYDREKESGISNQRLDDYLISALPALKSTAADTTVANNETAENIRNFVTLGKKFANKALTVDSAAIELTESSGYASASRSNSQDSSSFDGKTASSRDSNTNQRYGNISYLKTVDLQLIINILRQPLGIGAFRGGVNKDTYKALCILIKDKICQQAYLDILGQLTAIPQQNLALIRQIANSIVNALETDGESPMLDGLVALQTSLPLATPATYEQIIGLTLIANIYETVSLSLATRCYQHIVGQNDTTADIEAAQRIQVKLTSDFNNLLHPATQEYVINLLRKHQQDSIGSTWIKLIDQIAILIEHYPRDTWKKVSNLFKLQGINLPATAREFVTEHTRQPKLEQTMKTQLISIAWVALIITKLNTINNTKTFNMLVANSTIDLSKLDTIRRWLTQRANDKPDLPGSNNTESRIYMNLVQICQPELPTHDTTCNSLYEELQRTHPPKEEKRQTPHTQHVMRRAASSHGSISSNLSSYFGGRKDSASPGGSLESSSCSSAKNT